MRKPEIIKHKEKEILYINFSNLKKKEQIIELKDLSGNLIQQQEVNSVLALTNLEGMFFDYEIRSHFIQVAKKNTLHIKASAIIGLYGLLSVLYNGFIKITGRNIKQFKTKKEALEYLSSFE